MAAYSCFHADGRIQPSTGEASFELVDPTTGQPCGELRFCSARDLDLALQAARRGFEVWSRSSTEERKTALRRISEELALRSEAIVQSLAGEMGCPVWLGRLMQVPMALKDLAAIIDGVDRIAWSEAVGNGVVERLPIGVVGAITPWNFPLHQIVAKVGAAVAAGCSVVLKPSEVAPGAAWLLAQAVEAAGLPAGVFNLVWGDARLAAALVADPRVDQVSFTGSTAVGRRVMAGAAERVARLTLELGGKSAAVLLDDADLDAALPGVLRSALANSGQTCVCQSRLLVPRAKLREIEERLAALLPQWPLGDPRDEATRLGPVATRAQYLAVQGFIERAEAQGARRVAGGATGRSGLFVAPTIFSDVAPDCELAQQEVFGPVLAVTPYDTDEQALRLANGTAYGLSGAVWSGDAARATRFARGLRTGQVVVNGAAQNLATPFGGWGQSGFGRENGRFGIEDCLNHRAIHGAA